MSELFAEVRVGEATDELLTTLRDLGYSIKFVGAVVEVADVPAPEVEVEVDDGWTNVSGYPCGKEFTAFTSSNGIAKHLGGRCDCRNEGETCKPVMKGHVPAAEFNTRPGVSLVKDEVKQVFTLA